jgi:hypothetical protein
MLTMCAGRLRFIRRIELTKKTSQKLPGAVNA